MDSGFSLFLFFPALVVVWSLRLLFPELYRQRLRQSVTGTGLGGLKGVGVGVQCDGGLAVAQGSGDGPHILPIENQQRGVEVPELVNAVKGQTLFLAEFLEPLIGLLEADGGAVLFCKQTPALPPLVAQGKPLLGLFRPEVLHQVENPDGQFQHPAAFRGLCGGSENALLWRIEGGPADGNGMPLKVKVLELEAAQLLPPETAEQRQGEEHLPAERSVHQGVKECLGLFQCVAYLFFPSLQRRQRDVPAGVKLEHVHLDCVGEHGGNQGQVILDGLGRQPLVGMGLVRSRFSQTVDEFLYVAGCDFIHVEITGFHSKLV